MVLVLVLVVGGLEGGGFGLNYDDDWEGRMIGGNWCLR